MSVRHLIRFVAVFSVLFTFTEVGYCNRPLGMLIENKIEIGTGGAIDSLKTMADSADVAAGQTRDTLMQVQETVIRDTLLAGIAQDSLDQIRSAVLRDTLLATTAQDSLDALHVIGDTLSARATRTLDSLNTEMDSTAAREVRRETDVARDSVLVKANTTLLTANRDSLEIIKDSLDVRELARERDTGRDSVLVKANTTLLTASRDSMEIIKDSLDARELARERDTGRDSVLVKANTTLLTASRDSLEIVKDSLQTLQDEVGVVDDYIDTEVGQLIDTLQHVDDLIDTEIPNLTTTTARDTVLQKQAIDTLQHIDDLIDTEIPGITTTTARDTVLQKQAIDTLQHVDDLLDTEIPALTTTTARDTVLQKQAIDTLQHIDDLIDTEIPAMTATLTEIDTSLDNDGVGIAIIQAAVDTEVAQARDTLNARVSYLGYSDCEYDTISTPDAGAVTWTATSHRLATVTGLCAVKVIGYCAETLVGAVTIEVGIAGATDLLIDQTTDASTLVTGDVWLGQTTDSALPGGLIESDWVIVGATDIDITVGGAGVSDGIIRFIILSIPIGQTIGLANNGVAAAAWD